ncbi:adenosylcobinamide-GDP ribazoletransferase [Oceanidesulfovibrio marinus]|uniref:Adenosylcobinamide-GDP ribazoletransferase n=2 Tax=Oceanidesulfovibrio marinus TaxID=370038 RepID=A0ABX6NIX2_9BACT|nr:adenosylcobinamide-GDP ribazoletransferase [Oceanidesulfovibrio marinus]
MWDGEQMTPGEQPTPDSSSTTDKTAPPASRMDGAAIALGFLTRLGPARVFSPGALARSIVWFPFVGLVVGAICTAAVYGLEILAAGAPLGARATAGAVLYVALAAWLTRGLHWDGLADVADAWGSGARGERFWEIMKDSRSGAFAVFGLVLVGGGQLLLVREVISLGGWGALVFAPIAGRAACVCLAWAGRTLGRPGLGQMLLAGATPLITIFCVLQAKVVGLMLIRWEAYVLSFILGLVVVGGLARLGKRNGAMNGDLMGASIVCMETVVFFSVCVFA